jgi:hypothetical protein
MDSFDSGITWHAAVGAFPWLACLPPAAVDALDLDEFVLPRGKVAAIRARVERATGAYVMTYRLPAAAPARSDRIQLCRLLAAAPLTDSTLDHLLLGERETASAGVLLCAYHKPLRLLIDF